MRMYDIITKKKCGKELSDAEIAYVVSGYTDGSIPDYQMSAFLMACCLKGLSEKETISLTMEMANSGDVLDLSAIEGVTADKHSTGGVGDKTSLILGPLVAALGVPVAKMSGRGLGHTGGTIDKLESIPGFQTSISTEKFFENVNEMKLAIVGQTANLAPADKKIYALRDVTATVDNISLIAASIMSKKIAAGAQVIVLDVKTGSGAFMKTLEDSIALAEMMVRIGRGVGRKTYAVITDMNQVLGRNVGNALEVQEAIGVLAGDAEADLYEVSILLAAFMLMGCGKANTLEEAKQMLSDTIESGAALNKMVEFVQRQGGDASYVLNTELFPKTSIVYEVPSPCDGYVASTNAEEIGMTSLTLGGGRVTKDSVIDPAVGIRMNKKVGDYVRKGESLGTLYANDKESLSAAEQRFLNAFVLSEEPVDACKTVYGYVDETGYHEL